MVGNLNLNDTIDSVLGAIDDILDFEFENELNDGERDAKIEDLKNSVSSGDLWKFSKKGITPENVASTPLEPGELSRFVKANHNSCTADFWEAVSTYVKNIKNGEIRTMYFEKNDAMYDVVENFFNCKFGGMTSESNLMDLKRYINIRNRQLMGYPFKDEKLESYIIKKSYESGKPESFIFGRDIDIFKEMVWITTHSYMLDVLLTDEKIFDILTKIAESDHLDTWNSWIGKIDDIDPEILKAFEFDTTEKKCPMMEILQKGIGLTKEPISKEDIKDKKDKLEKIKEKIASKFNDKMDKTFKAAVDNDNDLVIDIEFEPVEEKKAEEPKQETPEQTEAPKDNAEEPAEEKEYTFKAAIETDVSSMVRNDQEEVKKELLKFFSDNNKIYHDQYGKKLKKITKIAKEAGLEIIYKDSMIYPGTLVAETYLVQDATSEIKSMFGIDPKIVYGNTMNVFTNFNHEGNIRKEVFIPYDNKEMVKKLITGTFTKKDRNECFKSIPRSISCFQDGGYCLLDKVDLSGIDNMKREDWYKFITYLSNVLMDDKVPLARYRVLEYKNPRQFTLVADEKVRQLTVNPMNIMMEQSAMDARLRHVTVEYNEDASEKIKVFPK